MNSSHTLPLLCLLTLLIHFGTGCVKAAVMQTARTTEVGKSEVVISGSFAATSFEEDFFGRGSEEKAVSLYPTLEGRVRHGLLENLDVGMNAGLMSGVGADAKLNIIDSKLIAVAVGAEAHFPFIDGVDRIDAALPVYISFHPLEYASFYALYRNYWTISKAETRHFHGMNYGVKLNIGKDYGTIFEISMLLDEFSNSDENVGSVQFNAGFFF